MIYLIKTSIFIEGETSEKDGSIFALKIRFSRDERGLARFSDYRENGLSFRILKYFPGGSYLLENRLHRYFKDYNIPSRSREWFYYNEKIIDTFLECNNISDLYKLFNADNDSDLRKQNYELKSNSYKINKELSILLEKFINEHPQDLNSVVFKFLQNFSSLTTFPERMRLLCTTSLNFDEIDIILSYIPKIFKKYYLVLGPDTCKSFSYRQKELSMEYEKQLNNGNIDVKEIILSSLFVGEKYTKPEIKDILTKAYEKGGYMATAKAVDILPYFNVKNCDITDKSTGKRLHGYQILSIKTLKTD